MALASESIPEFACQPIFFNQTRFRADLGEKPAITVFKDAIAGANTQFDRRFCEGEDIRFLVSERATFIDVLLHYAWHQSQWSNDISLIAVGGYGRAELHPHSDIDILILLENNCETDSNGTGDSIQAFITFLWDIGLQVGSSVRTVDECIQLAQTDITVATNLMEARRIAGNDALRDRLQVSTGAQYMWDISSFYRAKVDEQEKRHHKHHHTPHNLEPNVKNAPGGLRDVQTFNWIAKRYFDVQTIRQLEGQAFFTELEFAQLRKGEAFIWRVRYGLHYLAKRAEDRLLFDHQRELATLFAYEDSEGVLGVERFMHEYYRTASALYELNDVLLGILAENIFGKESSIRNIPIVPVTNEFHLIDDFIEAVHPKVFQKRPAALMDIFLLMGQNPSIKGVSASTIRLIRENRTLIDDNFRKDAHINATFIQILKVETGVLAQIRRMARYGILERYLPEFGRITGQMQHDLFHRYTVDAHTLLVIQNIRELLLDSSKETFPIAHQVMRKLPQKELLYIAALYHDIGKGRGGDHSELGAVDAELFCKQHGLNRRETRLVVWLVRYHLLMSYISQKKDISDPEVIQAFAEQMNDRLHLDYLFVLTIADMRGTNPDIWNSWRATLMRQLYQETTRTLRRGLENAIDEQDIVAETQQAALQILTARGQKEETATALWEHMGSDYFVRESAPDIAWQTEAIIHHKDNAPLILVRTGENPPWIGATQVFIYMQDIDHVFAAAAAALAHLNLNIQDARLYSSQSGFTVDTFYVLDENDETLQLTNEIKQTIQQTLIQELELVDEYSDVIKRRTPRQLKQFATPSRAKIYNDSYAKWTILEVITPDRPGLLATIGQVFLEFGIRLQNAKISTLGERVEDVFFITDKRHQALSDPEVCDQLIKTLCHKLDARVENET